MITETRIDRETFSAVDEVKPTKNCCMANVAEDGSYRSCGEPMRVRKDGFTTYCRTHGDMH